MAKRQLLMLKATTKRSYNIILDEKLADINDQAGRRQIFAHVAL